MRVKFDRNPPVKWIVSVKLSQHFWCRSLAQFCGKVYRKFYFMELKGMVQYVVSRLKQGHSLELCVFTELITHMACGAP